MFVMEELANTIDPPGLLAEAAVLRDGLFCKFARNALQSPVVTNHNIILLVEFLDGLKWAFHLPFQRRQCKNISDIFLAEMKAWNAADSHNVGLLPNLITGDSTFDNKVGFPFMVTEWLPGTQLLRWTDAFPWEEWQREKVLQSVAAFICELLEIEKESSTTAAQHITSKIDNKIHRVLKGQLPKSELRPILQQRSFVPKYIKDEGEEPWVLCPVDFSPANILIDEDFNVTGIIDLGQPEYLPRQLALTYPRFLHAHTELYSDPFNPRVDPNPQGGFEFVVDKAPRKVADRELFLAAIKDLNQEFAQSLERVDYTRWYWWLQAVRRFKVHLSMVRAGWLVIGHEADLKQEFRDWRTTNPEISVEERFWEILDEEHEPYLPQMWKNGF